MFFGTEEDEDAHFIMLNDCNHFFEVQSLDAWVLQDNESSGEIKFPHCPRCKTPIRKSLRYCNQVKQTLKDVEEIKRKQNVPKSDILEQFKTLSDAGIANSDEVKAIERYLKRDNLHPYRVNAISVQIAILSDAARVEKITSTIPSTVANLLSPQHAICDLISLHGSLSDARSFVMQDFLSHQQVSDIRSEIRRLLCAVKMCDLLCKMHNNQCKLTPEDEQSVKLTVQQLYCGGWKRAKLNEEDEESVLELIKQLSKSYQVNGITERERKQIVEAMGFSRGHWFKCPNGHYYCIADCGGAMQESKCPDCGALIGGRNHTLTADNAHAPEMDGSLHPAWSEAANLANFDPMQLRW